MADDSEYLCMLCGENEASHEYCDACLKTLRGDYVIASADGGGYDWVVHVTEEQEQYGYVADAVESMLSSGRERVFVWSGRRAQTAPDQCAPESVPARGRPHALQVHYKSLSRPLSDTWWEDLAGLVISGYEELVVIAETEAATLTSIGHPGRRQRPSALAR